MPAMVRSNVRWQMATLVAASVLVNYYDRNVIALAEKPIQDAFHLSLGTVGIVLSAFSWSYLVVQIPVGMLLDRVGIKWLNRVGTLVWAIASVLTAVAGGLGLVFVGRLLLGVAESPVYPGASKATSQWFPRHERGKPTSLFDSAMRVANVTGAPLLALIMATWGWRSGFYFLGLISLVFAVIWWACYRDPRAHPRVTTEELAYIEKDQDATSPTRVNYGLALGYLLRQRKIWAMTIGFSCYAYSGFLLTNWLPGYLETAMGLSVLKAGMYTVIPNAAGAVAEILLAGFLLDRAVRNRSRSGVDPRKLLIVVGFVASMALGLTGTTHSAGTAIVYIAFGNAGLALIGAVGWSLPGLLAPPELVGAAGGIMNTLNAATGIAATTITGFVAQLTGSFVVPFLVAVGVSAVGIVMYTAVIGEVRQLARPSWLQSGDTVDDSRSAAKALNHE
ncbi:MAG TPA: MFS transporter [Amycolatopsis sp.]|nr:MFS transporter [Amycolatopsis sp.]